MSGGNRNLCNYSTTRDHTLSIEAREALSVTNCRNLQDFVYNKQDCESLGYRAKLDICTRPFVNLSELNIDCSAFCNQVCSVTHIRLVLRSLSWYRLICKYHKKLCSYKQSTIYSALITHLAICKQNSMAVWCCGYDVGKHAMINVYQRKWKG